MNQGTNAVGGERYSLRRWKPVALDDLVRVGRQEDGGYVISRRCIETASTVVGLGIFDDWSFEEMFGQRQPGSAIVGVDASVSSAIFRSRSADHLARAMLSTVALRFKGATWRFRQAARWLERARSLDTFFRQSGRAFHQKFLSDFDDTWSITWSTLCRTESLIPADTSSPSVFVKMDIEGSEYRILGDLVADADRINGMVVEFHDCDLHWERFCESMDFLHEDFAVAHVHGNNYQPLIRGSSTPRVLEISFVNRRLIPDNLGGSTASYPLEGLDRPCDPSKPDYAIQF